MWPAESTPRFAETLIKKSQMKAKNAIKTTTKTSAKAKDIIAKKSPKGGKRF